MANNLPDLCLQNIFNNLNYDYETLYSCIFINKQWSYSSIPVLWSNPFHHTLQRRQRQESSNLKPLLDLLDTYLSFLPQNQQKELEIKPKFNSTMFNYPYYFRHMNLFLIHDGVKCWCKKSNVTENVIEKEIQLYKALIELFFTHSSKIDTLKICETGHINLLDIPGSKQVLSKIHKLMIDIEDFAFSTL
jgi:hypothetical protein